MGSLLDELTVPPDVLNTFKALEDSIIQATQEGNFKQAADGISQMRTLMESLGIEVNEGAVANMTRLEEMLRQAVARIDEASGGAFNLSGILFDAANEAQRLAMNLYNSAMAAEQAAGTSLVVMTAQMGALSAGQDEYIAGARARLDLEKQAYTQALIAGSMSATEARLATEAVFENREAALALSEAYRKAQEAARNAGRSGSSGARVATEALTEAERAAQAYAQALDNQVISAIDGVSNAWADFVVRGFNDFKGFANAVLNSFKSMLANMIAMAAKNRIMLSLGIGGVGAAGGASAGSIGGIAGQSLLSGGGMLAGTGLGTALGGLSSGFMTSVYGGLAGTAGAVSGGLAVGGIGGISTAIGAIAAPLAAVAAVFSFFRSKTKELDSGLKITIDNMGTLVESFRTVEKSRFWGLSKKVRTSLDEVEEGVANPIKNVVSNIQQGVVNMANALGIGANAFDDFAYTLDISLKGLTEEQATAKIQEELSKIGDAMADLVPDLANFSRNGETSSQTLSRLVSSLTLANSYFSQLSDTMFQVSLAGADLASSLIDAFGGIDNFNSQMSFFVQNFYSQAEQVAMASNRVNEAFKALGLAAPQTAEQFRQLVEGLMSAVASGVTGSAEQLAGVLATQGDIFTIDQYNQAEAAAALRQAQSEAEAARREAEAVAAEAARRAEQIANQRYAIETRILELQGNTNALRARELALLDPTNRALQEMVFSLEDSATRAEEVATKTEEAARKAEEIASERYSLETQILQLQGNTNALRDRELALLDPTNRALQQMVWGLEDAKDAMEAINEIDFATRVDYLRAVGLANMGLSIQSSTPNMMQPSPVINRLPSISAPTSAPQVSATEAEEDKELARRAFAEFIKYSKKSYDIFRQWDVDGLPEQRT
jgi:hypothetical protein